MLISDYLLYALVIAAIIVMVWGRRYPHWRLPWRQVMARPLGAISAVILTAYLAIGLLDSIHFQTTNSEGERVLCSVLDIILGSLGNDTEQTYSAPFSDHSFTLVMIDLPDGHQILGYSPLRYTQGNHWRAAPLAMVGFLCGIFSYLLLFGLFIWIYSRIKKQTIRRSLQQMMHHQTSIAWREIIATAFVVWLLIWICVFLAANYHILGTDKVGRDVFYQTLKSIRTGLVIGTLTTLFALPFALALGMMAGYFRGWIDDIIQYLYTTLSSIPGVLLISAAVLMLQVYMATHADSFLSLARRADIRLLALCFILGITGWAGLCRFLRAETLKLRELEFVQASKTLGATSLMVIRRHIMPNVFHIVLITLVLDFSGLVLAEAVLSYIGVGVDPATISWGNMINSSRLELAREPAVWWPLLAALISMFGLVLSANIFADIVRDAFDPHLNRS